MTIFFSMQDIFPKKIHTNSQYLGPECRALWFKLEKLVETMQDGLHICNMASHAEEPLGSRGHSLKAYAIDHPRRLK